MSDKKNTLNALAEVKKLAEQMNDVTWMSNADKIAQLAAQLLAELDEPEWPKQQAKQHASKQQTRGVKYLTSWTDMAGKKHYGVGKYNAAEGVIVLPADYFFSFDQKQKA